MVGVRFGKLTVLSEIEPSKYGRLYYECKCDCGLVYEARASHVKAGAIQQCRNCRNVNRGELMKQRALESHQINMGKRFGNFTVVDIFVNGKLSGVYYGCKCDCGNISLLQSYVVIVGKSTKCRKCADKLNEKHGMVYTPTYSTWFTMRRRCSDPKTQNYKRYGGRGIRVCDRWQSFENFLADMGVKPKGLQIDRIDNDGPYAPGNCRWVTPKENANNKGKLSRIII